MASETALGSIAEPERFADLTLIRQTMLDWRFYHVLRTDRDSPLRRPCLAVTSPTLSSDDSNLAAVFATAWRTQIWLVTHSEHLAASLRRHAAVDPHTVVKRGGETWIQGLKLVGVFEDDQE